MKERTLQQQVDAFASWLDRIGAVAPALHTLAGEISGGRIPPGLIARLEAVDRDLLLAAHELDLVRERAMREAASLGARHDTSP